jgi:hypothetical protein
MLIARELEIKVMESKGNMAASNRQINKITQ